MMYKKISHYYQKFSKNASTISLILILIYFCIIAGYHLDTLPGEWFGDISIVNNYVSEILSGKFPLYFSTSAGPLYFYLIAPFVYAFGVSFFTYKIISLGCGAIGLIIIYLFIRKISSEKVALLTTFITASSFWYIVWSRLGNFNIITPLLTALMLYFFFDFKQNKKYSSLFFSISASSLGLFTYPGVFFLPVVLFILFLVFVVKEKETVKKKTLFVILILISYLPAAGLFGYVVIHDYTNFSTGYMGTKTFPQVPMSLGEMLARTSQNALRTVSMLHKEGDIVFRWNVSKSPQLDVLSGIFFLMGCVYSLYSFRRYGWVFIPLLILLLPSILPTHPLVEIPSSPRTMAIIPIVFFITALGVDSMYTGIKRYLNKEIGLLVCVSILMSIALVNIHKYFIDYPKGLPNGNVSYGKVVASYINTFPNEYHIYFTVYQWGDWGQPSIDSIYFSLQNKEKRNYLLHEPLVINCLDIQNDGSSVIIFSPQEASTLHRFESCFPHASKKVYEVDNQKVFIALVIN